MTTQPSLQIDLFIDDNDQPQSLPFTEADLTNLTCADDLIQCLNRKLPANQQILSVGPQENTTYSGPEITLKDMKITISKQGIAPPTLYASTQDPGITQPAHADDGQPLFGAETD